MAFMLTFICNVVHHCKSHLSIASCVLFRESLLCSWPKLLMCLVRGMQQRPRRKQRPERPFVVESFWRDCGVPGRETCSTCVDK